MKGNDEAARLRQAAESLRGERVTLQQLAQAQGHRAQGALLVLLSVPTLLPVPGVGTLLGTATLVLALAMWRGQAARGLPERVARVELPQRWAQRVLRLMAWLHGLGARFGRRRWPLLARSRRRGLVPLAVALMAAIVIAPLPLGNVAPSLALVLIGTGLAQRDGAIVAAGLAAAAAATVFTALLTWALVAAGRWGFDALPGWLQGLA